MKLIIQIPCYNEEEHLAAAIADLPRSISGIDKIEFLVIDDGSSDKTAEVAKMNGVQHVVRHPINRGLASAFRTGIETAISLGADIVVNTDADNQYQGKDIVNLVNPILHRKADLVVGVRPINDIDHFSWIKKRLQALGSLVVRHISGTSIRDVTSGFRAYSREALIAINLTTQYTHTLETLIQAGNKNLIISQVDIGVNAKRRESRLFKSMYGYISRSMLDIFMIYLHYNGEKILKYLGLILMTPGIAIGLRFIWIEQHTQRGGHIQSLLLASILIIMAFQSFLMSLFLSSQKSSKILLENITSKFKVFKKLNDNPAPIPSSI